jgi:hypothetical protein
MKYYEGDKIKEDEMHGACAMNDRDAYKILVVKPEGKRPLRILRHR